MSLMYIRAHLHTKKRLLGPAIDRAENNILTHLAAEFLLPGPVPRHTVTACGCPSARI